MKRTEDELHRDELSQLPLLAEGPGDQRCLGVQDLHQDVNLLDRDLLCHVHWAWGLL